MENMNIYQRMSAITNEISRVAKNLSVNAGKSSYKAVGEADVLEAVKPAEQKYGVYSYPIDREIIESGIIETESVSGGAVYTRKQQFMRLRVVYRFVNIDKQGEFVDIATYGDGIDSGDKAPGKAMTYADKYALLKAYKITTGEDPDQKASEPLKDTTKPLREKKQPVPMASQKQIDFIAKLYMESEENAKYIESVCRDPRELTMAQATELIGNLKK